MTASSSANLSLVAACADIDLPVGPANLRAAERVSSPRAFRMLPAWAMAPGRAAQVVDARIHDDVVWILRRYRLRVTAAREAGHRTHGDGTAVDLVPADGATQAAWDASAGRLARHLGWSPACARSGTRPVCRLAPAIQFVGYDGYPGHGSPRTCAGSCAAHLHVSWVSPCYGSSRLSAALRMGDVVRHSADGVGGPRTRDLTPPPTGRWSGGVDQPLLETARESLSDLAEVDRPAHEVTAVRAEALDIPVWPNDREQRVAHRRPAQAFPARRSRRSGSSGSGAARPRVPQR